MPFRRLPDTDAGRLQALEAAEAKAAIVDPGDLAFSAESKATLDTLLPLLRTEMQERGVALGAQVSATAALTAQRDRLKMWGSHFLQNLNFGIDRGVFQASDRAFYQIPTSQESLPAMSREADLLMWTQRIIDGEAARTAAGGSAVLCPPVAEVSAERAAYVTLQADQSTKKDALDTEQEDVDALRPQADELILDIWDEVEFTYRKEPSASARDNAREYGVVYVTRPGEPSDPGQPGEPPAAPGAPTLTPGAPGEVTADWTAVEGATSYNVYKQEVGTDPDFVLHDNPSEPASLFTGLTPGATLRVYITAINDDGESDPSPTSETTVM